MRWPPWRRTCRSAGRRRRRTWACRCGCRAPATVAGRRALRSTRRGCRWCGRSAGCSGPCGPCRGSRRAHGAEAGVADGQAGDLGDPQPGLGCQDQERVVAAAVPGRLVRRGEDRVEFGGGELAKLTMVRPGADHRDLREGRPGPAVGPPAALPSGSRTVSLRQHAEDYLALCRALGRSVKNAGRMGASAVIGWLPSGRGPLAGRRPGRGARGRLRGTNALTRRSSGRGKWTGRASGPGRRCRPGTTWSGS